MILSSKHNLQTFFKLGVVALAMFGFGYALVPFYEVFCDLTGFGGKTQTATAGEAVDAVKSDRMITVQFTGSVQDGLHWDFKPVVWQMKVKAGELNDARFMVHNRENRDIVGQAVPSVTPSLASLYFMKTECFCFTQQTLRAGEEKEMWLKFYVDSELPEDIKTVTLSYAFFDAGKYVEKTADKTIADERS